LRVNSPVEQKRIADITSNINLRTTFEFSDVFAPNNKKFSELLAIRVETFKKEMRKAVPEPGAPSPPKAIKKSKEFGFFVP